MITPRINRALDNRVPEMHTCVAQKIHGASARREILRAVPLKQIRRAFVFQRFNSCFKIR
jgi:hypothetical protein